jgi:alkanesulfonate monooxygenase SsuD/methylene tetrahydromethanopterin reductase-like flavin-dependent oxidoreductase (luciferase family)
LPLCHPLRLAEEGATVDQISRGRLIFGVGRSGLPRTYEDYGVSYAESRDRFGEVLEIVEQAWSQPAVNYDGKYYSFHNIAVTPKPYQQPYPPIRIAAASPDTYPAVGARGLPILINARLGTFSEFAPAVREYREAYKAAFFNPRLGSFSEFAPAVREYRDAYEAAGYPGKGQVYLRVPTYLAETEDRAHAEPRESLMHFVREAIERLKDSMSRGGTRAIEGRAERLQRLENLTYDEALQGQVLIGTPASVGERLRALQDELGIDGILAELNCGGLIPHQQVLNAMRLLCQELMPQFH